MKGQAIVIAARLRLSTVRVYVHPSVMIHNDRSNDTHNCIMNHCKGVFVCVCVCACGWFAIAVYLKIIYKYLCVLKYK